MEKFAWSKRKLWKIGSCGKFRRKLWKFNEEVVEISYIFHDFHRKSPKCSPAAGNFGLHIPIKGDFSRLQRTILHYKSL